MRTRFVAVLFILWALSFTSYAQSNVTTAGGTPNTIPLFTGSLTLSDSAIAQLSANIGIGTTNPQSSLHISSSDVTLATNSAPFGSGNLLIQGNDTARSLAKGAALTFAIPANSDGSNPWEQGRIIVTPDAADTGDASGRMYLQTRFYNTTANTWDWRNNLVLTSNGNVGVGTTNPQSTLDVNGSLRVSGAGASITFPDGTVQTTALPANFTSSNGNVGIGTTSPTTLLDIESANPTVLIESTMALDSGTAGVEATLAFWGHYAVFPAASIYTYNDTPYESDLRFATGAAGLTDRMTILYSGNVGIGTTSPGAKLEVDGNVKLTAGSGAAITFADGTVQTTAYAGTSCPLADLVMPDNTIVAQGGDYAESVDVNGDRASYEPGDVMVIDPANPEHFLKSSKPYSTLVAGIYSTKPGYVGRRQPGDPKMAKTEIPMAMIGIVPTKVTTENGSINVGDLLVTSSTSGYAMKGTKRKAMSGAIVGKALTKLDSGTGTIEVLVSLQ